MFLKLLRGFNVKTTFVMSCGMNIQNWLWAIEVLVVFHICRGDRSIGLIPQTPVGIPGTVGSILLENVP